MHVFGNERENMRPASVPRGNRTRAPSPYRLENIICMKPNET